MVCSTAENVFHVDELVRKEGGESEGAGGRSEIGKGRSKRAPEKYMDKLCTKRV